MLFNIVWIASAGKSSFSLPLVVLVRTRGFLGMFMDARVNLLGVNERTRHKFSRAQVRARRSFSVEAFCSKCLLKEFSDTASDASVTNFISGPTDPSSMALSAPGMAGPKSGPADFRPVHDSPSRSVDPNHGLEEIQIDKLLGIRLVAGSIETGSFHLLLLSKVRVFTHSFRGVLF